MRRIPDGIPAASTKDRYKEGTLKNRMPSFVVVSNIEDSIWVVAQAVAAGETPDTRPVTFSLYLPQKAERRIWRRSPGRYLMCQRLDRGFSSCLFLCQPARSLSFSHVFRLAE